MIRIGKPIILNFNLKFSEKKNIDVEKLKHIITKKNNIYIRRYSLKPFWKIEKHKNNNNETIFYNIMWIWKNSNHNMVWKLKNCLPLYGKKFFWFSKQLFSIKYFHGNICEENNTFNASLSQVCVRFTFCRYMFFTKSK